MQEVKRLELMIFLFIAPFIGDQMEDMHHFRKPANDITSQLEINFGDLCRPNRGRGGPRGGRGGRGRGSGSGPGFSGETTRPARPRSEKVEVLFEMRKTPIPILIMKVGWSCFTTVSCAFSPQSSVSVPNVDDPEAFPALA